MAKQDIINDTRYRAIARIQSIDIEIKFLELERALCEQLLKNEKGAKVPVSKELSEYCIKQYQEGGGLIEFSIQYGSEFNRAKAQKIKEIALMATETELKA